jgi:hypothetical protein
MLHVSFAKAKEKEKQYKEAADAYEKGKDTDNLVRLCLDHLQVRVPDSGLHLHIA